MLYQLSYLAMVYCYFMSYEDGDQESDGRVHLALIRPKGPVPQTRGDCLEGGYNAARPCGWITCRWWLYPEVRGEPPLCVLDVADQGGLTLEEVGTMMGVTRERVRQIEFKALRKIARLDSVYHRNILRNLSDGAEVGADSGWENWHI